MASPNPFGSDPFGFNSLLAGSGRTTFPSFTSSNAPNPFTLLQLMQIQQAKKKKGDTFFDKIKSGAVHGVGDVLTSALSQISRPGWAVAEGTREALHGADNAFHPINFAKGFEKGLTGQKHTGFGEVLNEHGVLKNHNFLRGLVGFGADVTTDPINLLLLAAAPETGGASLIPLIGKEALLAGTKASAKDIAVAAATKASRGFENTDQAKHAIKILEQSGPEWKTSLELARKHHDLMTAQKVADGPFFSPSPLVDIKHNPELQSFAAGTRAEIAKNLGPKNLQVRYKIPFKRAGDSLETGVGKLNKGAINLTPRLPIKAPSLMRVADGASKLNKIPLAGSTAAHVSEQLGKTFKPGWRNEIYHAQERVAKRHAEFLHRIYRRENDLALKPYMKGGAHHLSQDDQLKALEFGENNADLVPATSRKLNEPMLRAAVAFGAVSKHQAEFIRAWHGITEKMRERDLLYGIKYDKQIETGGLYVPHMYTTKGMALDPEMKTRVATLLSKKGFQYGRDHATSLRLLKEANDSGTLRKEVETDPVTLLAARTRRGSLAQADKSLSNAIAKSQGVVTHIPDVPKLAKLEKERTLLQEGKTYVDKRGRERRVKGLADTKLMDPHELHQLVEATMAGRKIGRMGEVAARSQKRDEAIAFHNKEITRISRASKSRATKQSRAWPKNIFATGDKELKAIIKDPAALRAARSAKRKFAEVSVHRSRLSKAVMLKKELHRIAPVTGSKAHGSKYQAFLKRAMRELGDGAKPGDNARMRAAILAGGPLRPLSKKEVNGVYDTWEKRAHAYLDTVQKAASEDIKRTRLEAQGEWDLARQAQKGLPKVGRNYKAQIAGHQRGIERAHKDFNRWLMGSTQKHIKGTDKAVMGVKAQAVKAEELNAKLTEKLEKNSNATHKALTSAINPDVPADWMEVSKLKLPGPHGTEVTVAVSPQIREAMLRSRKVISDDEALKNWDNWYRKAIAKWKVGATVVNTGYAVRNALSDYWNMYISGVPAWAMAHYTGKAVQLNELARKVERNPAMLRNLNAKDRKLMDTFIEAYHHGILSGLYEGDIQQIAKFMRSGTGDGAMAHLKTGHPLAAAVRVMGDFNRHRENVGRLSHYLYRRNYEKLGAADAAEHVKSAHFDYEDLTSFEQKLKANVIPFYTWTRKNIPYQITQLASRPGKYAAFPEFASEMETAAGGDKGTIVPKYLNASEAFHVPFGGKHTYLNEQIGPSDLGRMLTPQGPLSMLNPAIKTPLELLSGHNFGTGQPIKGTAHPRNPISTDLGGLLRMIPGSDFGRTERTVNGKQLGGLGASPYLTYLAGQTPITNFLLNQQASIRKAQRGKNNAKAAYLGGVALNNIDPEQQKQVALLQFMDDFQRYERGLKDENFLPESKKKKLSAAQRALIAQLVASQGRT